MDKKQTIEKAEEAEGSSETIIYSYERARHNKMAGKFAFSSLPIAYLIGLIVASQALAISGEQHQQEQSNGLNQGSFASDYQLSGIDSLMNLVGSPSMLQNKRARKMSAFMPMRGRKDGRDGGQQLMATLEALEGSPETSSAGEFMIHENDNDSPSIQRLVSATPDLRWVGVAPRQFANQLVSRHMLVGPSMSSSALSPYDGSESSGMMQAKLRRAFHPMRGKKADGLFAPANQPFEIAYPADIQADA